MEHIGILKNTIQEYAWGSHTAIAELLGRPAPSENPQAELWMGAHPRSPSLVDIGGEWVPLTEAIRRHPQPVLGAETAGRYHSQLPYLFKVLAAAKPLSIQAHPSMPQAIAGFERENQRGIAIDAPERNYRDPNHKPECLCALTPFWALSGFRPTEDILRLLASVWPDRRMTDLDLLASDGNGEGAKRFFGFLMSLSEREKLGIIQAATGKLQSLPEEESAYRWAEALCREHPADIGVLSPMLLNLVCLEPRQAIYLPAGTLHAYLDGVGIELMANSDNVLRGGLTRKHIDVPELLSVVDFSQSDGTTIAPVQAGPSEYTYVCPAEEFELSLLSTKSDLAYKSSKNRSVEILLCVKGQALVTERGGYVRTAMRKGTSVIVPASVNGYDIEGDADIFRAAVPM